MKMAYVVEVYLALTQMGSPKHLILVVCIASFLSPTAHCMDHNVASLMVCTIPIILFVLVK